MRPPVIDSRPATAATRPIHNAPAEPARDEPTIATPVVSFIRTTWPTPLNPITYAGIWRLGGIVARVAGGGRVRLRPL